MSSDYDNRATVLDLPADCILKHSAEPEYAGIEPLPGRALVRMGTRPETAGGILMTDREQHTCDVGVIAAVGSNDLGLKPGQFVAVRPYCGMYLDMEHRLLGVGDDLEHCLPAYLIRGPQDIWFPLPLGDWRLAMRQPSTSALVLPDSLRPWSYPGMMLGLADDADIVDRRAPWQMGFRDALMIHGTDTCLCRA